MDRACSASARSRGGFEGVLRWESGREEEVKKVPNVKARCSVLGEMDLEASTGAL